MGSRGFSSAANATSFLRLLRLAMRVSAGTTIRVAYALPFLLVWLNFSAIAQGFGPTSVQQPTFDCAKARSPLALLICSGGDTARADWDLRVASWARYFSLDERDRTEFWESQDKWLKTIPQRCGLITQGPPFFREQISCVVAAYKGLAAAYRSKLRVEALAESNLTPEQLAKIQQALIGLGFLNGKADGEFGPATRPARGKKQ